MTETLTDIPQGTDVPPLTEANAEGHLTAICFKIGPPRLTGVEAEWFVHDLRYPDAAVDPRRVNRALAALPSGPDRRPPGPLFPAGSALTHEPGGQVELSSPPAESPGDCAEGLLLDQGALRSAFAAEGLRLTGSGTDPLARERRMQLPLPRYLAMARHFDRSGPWGRTMMCGTASLQVCVDAGTERGRASYTERWRLLHLLGPVLVAAFANSPLLDGRLTGHRSTRQIIWSRMDPTRTLAPRLADGDPAENWARYVLDAELMCIRRGDGHSWSAPAGRTFRDWLRDGGERPPTVADLDYHCTTLFPPIRPRGHLELRMIDAQPESGWLVPLALVTGLLDDPAATDAALAALEPLGTLDHLPPRSGLWRRAATLAMTDPALRRAALACFAAAEQALGRRADGERLRGALARFAERHPARGRCPADDQLDALRAGVRPVPQESAPC
ncbi:ergothioneine biosynthesis glutamate--cysteine ligase EgtA [Kitasatospora sp. HPMI-4]|uniref:ergothioneine biosynthesis glutamate--cysteine ligase EgtA n=1 Tax=Kitasatospora sp. HPMI-4 TaxID=3448443 RepID=UPI003F1D0133